MAIGFYSTKERYGEFSNFSAFGIELVGLWYPTSEHYFQSQKFEDADHCERIRLAKSPMIAARLGRSRKVRIRGDWETIKVDVMRKAVHKKFATHAELAKLLLSTGEEELVEAAPGDYFWGCGKDGSGRNWLGQILMEVREQLKQEKAS